MTFYFFQNRRINVSLVIILFCTEFYHLFSRYRLQFVFWLGSLFGLGIPAFLAKVMARCPIERITNVFAIFAHNVLVNFGHRCNTKSSCNTKSTCNRIRIRFVGRSRKTRIRNECVVPKTFRMDDLLTALCAKNVGIHQHLLAVATLHSFFLFFFVQNGEDTFTIMVMCRKITTFRKQIPRTKCFQNQLG